MPATCRRRPGTTYLTTAPATTRAAAIPNVAQAVAPPTDQAQTRIDPITRIEPGRIGTRMPSSPTATPTATRASTGLTPDTFAQRMGPKCTAAPDCGPGPRWKSDRQRSPSGAECGVAF